MLGKKIKTNAMALGALLHEVTEDQAAVIRIGQFLFQRLPLTVIPADDLFGFNIEINIESGV
jgi:hypothetical protein